MEIPFIGPSYVARSKSIDCERCINWYPELVESVNGKTKLSLIGVPGKRKWISLPKAPIRGQYLVPGANLGVTDRFFAVANNTLYEITKVGTITSRGTLDTLSGFVCMSNNPTQLMITDGLRIYIFMLADTTFTISGTTTPVLPAGVTVLSTDPVNNTATCFAPAGTFVKIVNTTTSDIGNLNTPIGGSTCTFMDSYLITHQNGTNKFAISDNNNGLSWDGLDQAEKEGSPDQIVAVATVHRNLALFGQYTTEIWYDTGAATFPLAPVQGVFLENGLAAPFSLIKMDNTVFWVGYDKTGWGIVYRLNGYSPERVSTHAIEKIINDTGSAPLINSYTYQEEGHSFLVLNAPNLGTTLVYDSSTTYWHERQSIDFTGVLNRDRVGFHTFVFGQHILGDFQTSDLYTSDLDYYMDADKPLRRIRISPHYHTDLNYTYYRDFQVDMEVGVGLDGDPTVGTNPKAILKLSNDGGYSFGSEIYATMGKIGQRKARVRWQNLGRARDRVVWFEVCDPVKADLVAAYVNAKPGYN